MIADEYSYAQILELLGNNEDYLQWFTTSYYASYMLGMRTFQGNTEIDLTDYYYLQEQTKYHLLVTAMGDALPPSTILTDPMIRSRYGST